MSSQCPRFKVSRLRSVLLWSGAMLAVGAWAPASFAQLLRPDSIPEELAHEDRERSSCEHSERSRQQ